MNGNWVLCLSMVAGGMLTFATRAIFLLGGERFSLGPNFRALLVYVPPAVLAALIAPEIFVHKGDLVLGLDNPRLWAALAAVLAALITRSVLVTIALGLAVLWGIQFI